MFKLQREEVIKTQERFNKNSDRSHRVIIRCDRYISQFNDGVRSQASPMPLKNCSKVRVHRIRTHQMYHPDIELAPQVSNKKKCWPSLQYKV